MITLPLISGKVIISPTKKERCSALFFVSELGILDRFESFSIHRAGRSGALTPKARPSTLTINFYHRRRILSRRELPPSPFWLPAPPASSEDRAEQARS